MFARILKPNKPAKGRLFLSKKSTDDGYLIAVKNKKFEFHSWAKEKTAKQLFRNMHPFEITHS